MSSNLTPSEEPQDGSTVATVLAAEAIQEIQQVHQILQTENSKKQAKAAPISPQRIAKHFLLLDRDTHEPRFSPAQIEAALRMPSSVERVLNRRERQFSTWMVDSTPDGEATTFANAPTISAVLSTPSLPAAFLILIEDSQHGEYHIKVPITTAHTTVGQTLQFLQRHCGHG